MEENNNENQKSFILYPNEKQKNIIEDTFKSYMKIYNKLIQYSRDIGKENAVRYANKAKLYRVVNDMKLKDKSLSIMDNSALENLIDTYKYDLEHVIRSNRRFPLKKVTTKTYIVNNSLDKTNVDFFNGGYIKLPKMGYVKINTKNDGIPIDSNIDKAIIRKDESDNYRINIKYNNMENKGDNDREKRKKEFWSYYELGILPDGNTIDNENVKCKRKLKIRDMKIDTERRSNLDKLNGLPIKKEIVRIEYINRDYVKKSDEYDHAMKLYKKHPEKFSRGVIFGHTIVIPKEDGVDFDVIYDKNSISEYRKWNVKMTDIEREAIIRNCQANVLKYFPEVYGEEEDNNVIMDSDIELSEEDYMKEEEIKNDSEFNIEVEDMVEEDNDVNTNYDVMIRDDELEQLLMNSMIPDKTISTRKTNVGYVPNYQFSGNSTWQYNNNYYNTQY